MNNDEVIFVYSRADALADGELVDVTVEADRYGGFKVPVAVSRALWNILAFVPANSGESLDARLQDLLLVASVNARCCGPDASSVQFAVRFTVPDGDSPVQHLMLVVHGGDNAEPVITIGYPDDF